MFARIKRTGGRAYLVLVENERLFNRAELRTEHRQRVIARLGRVDHLDTDRQETLRQAVTAAVADIEAIRPKHGRGLVV